MSISRLALCALVILSFTPAHAQGRGPEVTCKACLLIDDTGRGLFRRNASTMLPNASTTKMTTALVVRAHARPDEAVLASPNAAATGGGGLDLRAGEVYSVEALLYALLLDSSNDAAVALAEHVAGSEGDFVRLMNGLARRLGATDTHFVTAHGLDMPGHGSSARDLATVATHVLDDHLLAAIVASPHARVDGPNGTVSLENRNLLLESYPGATGVKTGFTADAGNVLVASAERDGRRLIAVVMDSVDATADSGALLDLGWDLLARTIVLPKGTEVGALVFDQGSTVVVAAQPVRASVPPDEVVFRFVPRGTFPLPVEPGDVVGEVVVMSDAGALDTVDAVATGAVMAEDRSWMSDVCAVLISAVGRAMTAQW